MLTAPCLRTDETSSLHEMSHNLEARRTAPYWMVLSRFFAKTKHLVDRMYSLSDILSGGEDSDRLYSLLNKPYEKKREEVSIWYHWSMPCKK